MDQGSTKKRSAVHNFVPTVTKFCVMWEGLSLPHDTKFGNCRGEIVDRRMVFIWSLIHGSGWSRLIKAEPDTSQEDYFSTLKYQRSLYANFRNGILPLQAAIRRFRKFPLEEGLNSLCFMDQLEGWRRISRFVCVSVLNMMTSHISKLPVCSPHFMY